jgi:hypothetical protein
MIAAPLNDEDCLGPITARVFAALQRPDVRELAARLGTLDAADRYLRMLPQLDDGPDDPTPGPRVQCDVPQRVRVLAKDPNCVERALTRMALGELINPRPVRQLMTVQLGPALRHTLLVEDGEPVWLDPAVPRNALRAGLYRMVRNASGDQGEPLAPIDALRWVVGLASEPASKSATGRVRHRRATLDVGRIARGLLPIEPAALSWALKAAVPEALLFGPEGSLALMAAANVLDAVAGTPPSTTSSSTGTPPATSTSAGIPPPPGSSTTPATSGATSAKPSSASTLEASPSSA